MDEQLLGLAEIMELYAIDKSTASNWSRSRDFPAPRWKLKMGPIWTLHQLERWRVPARTVDPAGDIPPALILSVDVDLPGTPRQTMGVTVKCPLCPKKHYHSARLGPRVPHCSIPHFRAQYEIIDPNGLLAQAAEKYKTPQEETK